MRSCKFCGSTIGFYTKLVGVQYYDSDATPQGYDVDVSSNSIYCKKCHKRICSLQKFLNEDVNKEKK